MCCVHKGDCIALPANNQQVLEWQCDAIEHAQSGGPDLRLHHRAIEPAFAPLGYDWQLSIGVLTSFAAREVFVSTLAVLFSGSDDAEDPTVLERIEHATRSDGSPLFTRATAASLLVLYVLAMQCLPTLAVTRRETGSWKWALLQLAYMTVVAYIAAAITRGALNFAGIG